MNKKKIKVIIFCVMMFMLFNCMSVYAANTPRVIDSEYLYFDLFYGNVTILGNEYTGYVLQDGVAVQKTGTVDRKIYIYQSNGANTTWEDGLPKYDRVKAPNGSSKNYWYEYIINNKSVEDVIDNWGPQAQSVNRKPTNYRIDINSSSVDVTVDNIWSNYHNGSTSRRDGGISFWPGSVSNVTAIRLKGDNRIGNLYYSCSSTTYKGEQLIIQGDNDATITVADLEKTSKKNYWNSAIGGSDTNGSTTAGLIFKSGIVYAGTTYADNCSAIGGGGNEKGDIKIEGGIITAVCSSTGTAIGGGIGYNSYGGDANIEITGGTIYAYNFGYEGIPAAAIGGASSCNSNGNKTTTINITGGTVYAESVAGTAIGGGSSKNLNGGAATINLGGDAHVIAKSIGGNYNSEILQAGAAIGGGTGGLTSGSYGGNATVTISGNAKVYTGSIGGGKTNNSTGRIGSATIKIMDNPFIQGQFIMAAGAGTSCSFNMTGGTIDNSKKTDEFIFLEENGGAVYVENGDAIMSGGIIEGCHNAINGGAVYVDGGNFTLTDGVIKNNSAIKGGAVYVSTGNFTINGGNLGMIQNNVKSENRASQGGAIYVVGGNFQMNGGIIEGNTATNSGGGVQISDGNVYITGGKISSNVARGEDGYTGYGGGIFVDGGEVVSITGGEISKNVAAKNGGGIEIKTENDVTVDVYSGRFIDNVADECGGAVGIECANGVINVGKENCDGASNSSHIHPVLSENIAGIEGGGFYMTGTNAVLNIYCGTIDNNVVVEVENNFDQSSGTVTVHEGVSIGNSNEGIIVVGGTFIDKRTKDEDKFKVVYYSNFEGSTECKEALITNGSTITLPGNIFGVDGYAVIGWVRDKNNTSRIDYEVGEVIKIKEEITLYALWVLEEKNEPSYIVVIPEIISFGNDSIISFDIGVTLELFPRDKVLVIRASEEDLNLKLYSDGIEIDSTPYKIVKDDMEIGSGGVIASFYSDSSLITYNSVETLGLKVTGTQKYVGDYIGVLTFVVSIDDM